MVIKEIYHPQPETIDEGETIASAIEKMMNNIFNGFIVVNKSDRVVGVLSVQDIAAATVPAEFQKNINLPLAMYKKGFFEEECQNIKNKKVKEIMRTSYIKVNLNTNILAVTADFLKNDLYIVPVLDNDKLVGIITRTEIKKAIALGMGIQS